MLLFFGPDINYKTYKPHINKNLATFKNQTYVVI